MAKTQMILFHRPSNNRVISGSIYASQSTNYSYRLQQNPNEVITGPFQSIVRPNSPATQGLNIDLFEDISIPITYTILDVREPEKRKTSWSKTILIPGTKNNNRIFSHIYEIGQDGWVTIGNTSVYEGFNPNLRKEVIVNSDGVQIMKGNMQMKRIKRDKDGNIEYEISLNGDLTSLFYDVGTSKLTDLNWSEWDHEWNKENIINSWSGISKKTDDTTYNSIVSGSAVQIKRIFMSVTTGRLSIETFTNHGLQEDYWVNIDLYTGSAATKKLLAASGEWVVTEIISSKIFSVNYFYPKAFAEYGANGWTLPTGSESSYMYRRTATGKGYVYPMISWGDEFDYNSFPVTSFAPGFYVKEIFDKIMAETNSKYESDFLDSQFFKRLILLQKKPTYDINPREVSSRKFWVGLTQSYLTGCSFREQYWSGNNGGLWLNTTTPGLTAPTASQSANAGLFPSTTANKIPFNESGSFAVSQYENQSFYDGLTGTSSYNNWDSQGYKWKVQRSGEYTLTTNIKLSCWCDMNGYVGFPGTGTSSFTPSTKEYFPGTFNSNGPLGTNKTGVYVRFKIYRQRSNGPVDEIGTAEYKFDMNNNAKWSAGNTSNWKYFGRYQKDSWENVSITIPSTSTYFNENDEVWVEAKFFTQGDYGDYLGTPFNARRMIASFYERYPSDDPNYPYETNMINGEWFLQLNAASYIFNDPTPKSIENSTIEATNFLPKDMSCKDFLLSVIKMFNLHIEPDKQVEKKYYIEPRDTYYKDGSGGLSDYVDWTDKIDETSVDIIPMGELIAKYYIFENKEENDYWNARFKTDRGRPYSQYTKEIENDFLKNEVKVSIPLGTTMMINNPVDSDVVIPSIIQKESNGSFKPVSNSQPRMLIWGGKRPYTSQRGGATPNLNNAYFGNISGWEMLSGSASAAVSASSSVFNYYPYAGTVDSPTDPVYDINWYNMEENDFVYWDAARWTNENLYNKYWRNFIEEISDPASKVVIADLRLTPKDIYSLDFRKIYVIEGHYMRLQKVIDYDPVVNGLTRCEFLKLKSPSKFRRRSMTIDSNGFTDVQFSVNVNTTRPVIVTNIEVAPSRKRPEFGFNNTTPGVNLSNNSSVVTNGLSNYVGAGGRNIKVNGNENAVGGNATNIHISSGNGNYISGNVNNVNVIGTDKKYIAESDVTYINGIRYKNGIPISKSNVIDGGINVAVVRQSNSTTATTIDGSEDVVISAGSTTYENVIDPGVDAILPDQVELGISTQANPNPRTNLAGGYEIDLVDQSYVQVVRQRDEYKS
jgi:hypothetical protein